MTVQGTGGEGAERETCKGRGFGRKVRSVCEKQIIDGTVAGSERQRRIDRLDTCPDAFPLILLSTLSGGLGMNLATADSHNLQQ